MKLAKIKMQIKGEKEPTNVSFHIHTSIHGKFWKMCKNAETKTGPFLKKDKAKF